MRADLHIHSYLSDGRYSPSKIIEFAVQKHLNIISLTDHDTIAGIDEARRVIRTSETLQLIPGVEVSTCIGTEEIHILGYGINDTHPGLLELLANAQANRIKRVCHILDGLKAVGVSITVEEVKNGYQTVSPGRMHIAHALIKRGYVRNFREAFDQYLNYGLNHGEYLATYFISSHRAIELILDAGGIPILAHPSIELFDRHVDALMTSGLAGVEVFKDARSSIEEFYFETVVKDKGLLSTGGSDWHGYHQTRNLGDFYVDATRIQPFLRTLCA